MAQYVDVQDWQTFKALCENANYRGVTYVETSSTYELLFCDTITFRIVILKDSPEAIDFETTLKPNISNTSPLSKRDSDGNIIQTISVFGHTNDLYPKEEEFKYTAPPGVISIFDEEINTERRLAGGKYWITEDTVDNVHPDDIAKFGIVDKNDVLGLFSAYNLPPPPSGILEFPKFVKAKYIKKGSKECGYQDTVNLPENCASPICAGLFARTIIDRTNATSGDITLIVGFKFYE